MSSIMNLRLRYFPFPGRAGPIRDALNIGGIEFEDDYVAPDSFRQLREDGEFPFGGLPVIDIETSDGKVCSAQSNAILRFAGRLAGLYPADDPILALKVDEAMGMGEEFNTTLGPSMSEDDMEKKMAMRKTLRETTLPNMLGFMERYIINNGNTGFLVGNSLTVADLKFYWVADTLTNGNLDGVPQTILNDYSAIVAWRKNINRSREERLKKYKECC